MQRSGRVWLGEEWDHQGLAAYSLALGWLETPLLALHLVSLSRTIYAALQPKCRFLAQSRCVWVFGSFLPWEQCSWVTVLWLVSWSPENRKGQKMHLSQYQGSPKDWKGWSLLHHPVEARVWALFPMKGMLLQPHGQGLGPLVSLTFRGCFMVIKFFVPLGPNRSFGWGGQEWWQWWRGRWRWWWQRQPVCTEPSRVPGTVLKTSCVLTPEASQQRQEVENYFLMPREAET